MYELLIHFVKSKIMAVPIFKFHSLYYMCIPTLTAIGKQFANLQWFEVK